MLSVLTIGKNAIGRCILNTASRSKNWLAEKDAFDHLCRRYLPRTVMEIGNKRIKLKGNSDTATYGKCTIDLFNIVGVLIEDCAGLVTVEEN